MTSRNVAIDIYKLVLVFFVVVAHLLPYTFENEKLSYVSYLIHGICRTVVPIFFIISGYFFSKKVETFDKIKPALIRFFKMFVIWQIIYSYLTYLLYKNGLIHIEDIFINAIFGFGHLWYLSALFFGFYLTYLTRNLTIKTKTLLAITLVIIGFTFQVIFELKLLPSYLTIIYKYIGTTRNFMFFGFPYILLGTLVSKLKIKANLFTITCLFLLVLCEALIYKILKMNISNFFITALPFSLYSFYYVNLKKVKINLNINPKLVLGIYLIHFYPVFYLTLNYPFNDVVSVILKIIITLLSSTVIFFILNKFDKKLKILF